MDVIICKTSADAEKLAARMIADAINAKPEFKLGLATGATMEGVYAELSRLNKAGEVDFSQVRSWNLDEYGVESALNAKPWGDADVVFFDRKKITVRLGGGTCLALEMKIK